MFIYENNLNVTLLPKSTIFAYFEYFLFRFLYSSAYLIFLEIQSGKYLNICLSYNFYCERDVVKRSKLQLLNEVTMERLSPRITHAHIRKPHDDVFSINTVLSDE